MSDTLAAVLDAIDQLSAVDLRRLDVGAGPEPKELVHARMVTAWLLRLQPDASEALQIAGRAHHLERWKIPRESHPDGREGYLRWRRALQDHHVARTLEVLREHGCEDALCQRVEDILRKRNLRRDAETQCFEDALCLVFLETEFRELAERLGNEKMTQVLRRTLPKMSDQGKQAALTIDFDPRDRALLAAALEAPAARHG